MGKLLVKFLAQDFNVFVYDKLNYHDEIKALGATPVDLKDVASKDLIIPIVPICEFDGLMFEMGKLIKAGALVADVCSVKEHPVAVMEKYLRPDVEILGTHPMFGPDSARDTLYGTKVVLCPVRINDERFHNIKAYLKNLGIRIIEATPMDHDRMVGDSLLLTHFIGRGLISYGARDLQVDTKGYRRLMKILGTVENDSWQLFEDMNRYNRFSKNVREKFLNALNSIDQKVRGN